MKIYTAIFLFFILVALNSCTNSTAPKDNNALSSDSSVTSKEYNDSIEHLKQEQRRQSMIADSIRQIESKKQRYERYIAEKKNNPIRTNFFGAVLGKTSLKSLRQTLKSAGYKMELYGEGSGGDFYFKDYMCNGGADIDGIYWEEIRIGVRDNVFYSIELIRDWRTGNGIKRIFTQEVNTFFRNVVSTYSEKYSFWKSEEYDETCSFTDGSTKIEIGSDGGYTARITFKMAK